MLQPDQYAFSRHTRLASRQQAKLLRSRTQGCATRCASDETPTQLLVCHLLHSAETGTMSGGGGRPRGGLMRLGNAAPRVAAADAQAAAKELAAADKALQQAEAELRQARSNRCDMLAAIVRQGLSTVDSLCCRIVTAHSLESVPDPFSRSLLQFCVSIVCRFWGCRDAAERDLAKAEKAVKQLELAAPKAAQLAAAKREEAADLEARLGQLQVCLVVCVCGCAACMLTRAMHSFKCFEAQQPRLCVSSSC